MAERTPIIIKKMKKSHHEEHHGSSWKVAYADFVTAMMAFFLLLWLLAMISPEKRAAMSEYFRNFNLFRDVTTAGSKGMMNKEGLLGDKQNSLVKSTNAMTGRVNSRGEKEIIAERLKKAIDEKLRAYSDQIYVDIVEGGVRIQLVDAEGKEMFALGSAEPTPRAKQILSVIAENIQDLQNKVAIEGHTDAAPFKSSQITNWELSTARASAARRELESKGLDPQRIARVVGFADQELFIKDNPRDPRNRRISVTILTGNQGMVPRSSMRNF
ncbi:MAG: OmpA family protein [Syntrophales bacterium]|nr:OmpA family protein [Syntrophales bacterium]